VAHGDGLVSHRLEVATTCCLFYVRNAANIYHP